MVLPSPVADRAVAHGAVAHGAVAHGPPGPFEGKLLSRPCGAAVAVNRLARYLRWAMSGRNHDRSGAQRQSARRCWVPDRPEKRGAPPARVGEILVGTQEYIAKRTGALMSQEEWRRIVGAKIAGRTRVGRLNRGVLTIKVATSAWSSELSFLKPELLRKLSEYGHDVRRLRFQVDQDFPSSRPQRRRARSNAFSQAGKSENLPVELQRRLRLIDDPNLRAAVAEAATSSLLSRKPGGSSEER